MRRTVSATAQAAGAHHGLPPNDRGVRGDERIAFHQPVAEADEWLDEVGRAVRGPGLLRHPVRGAPQACGPPCVDAWARPRTRARAARSRCRSRGSGARRPTGRRSPAARPAPLRWSPRSFVLRHRSSDRGRAPRPRAPCPSSPCRKHGMPAGSVHPPQQVTVRRGPAVAEPSFETYAAASPVVVLTLRLTIPGPVTSDDRSTVYAVLRATGVERLAIGEPLAAGAVAQVTVPCDHPLSGALKKSPPRVESLFVLLPTVKVSRALLTVEHVVGTSNFSRKCTTGLLSAVSRLDVPALSVVFVASIVASSVGTSVSVVPPPPLGPVVAEAVAGGDSPFALTAVTE